jgi:hypothetical protein
MNPDKRFIQIITQEKSKNEDYRSFLICTASNGSKWELRGYGKTAISSVTDVWRKFQDSEETWCFCGYTID